MHLSAHVDMHTYARKHAHKHRHTRTNARTRAAAMHAQTHSCVCARARARTRPRARTKACVHMHQLRDMRRHARTCARACACVRARSHEGTCRTHSQLTPARARPLPPRAIGHAQVTSLRSLSSSELGHAASLNHGLGVARQKYQKRVPRTLQVAFACTEDTYTRTLSSKLLNFYDMWC